MRRLAAILALAVALAASLLTGCGGSDDINTYKTEFADAAREFKHSVDEATTRAAGAQSLRERAPALESFKGSVDNFAARLDRLDPPDDVSRLNDRAVAQLRRLSADLDRVRQAAEADDQHAVEALAARLQSDQAELQDTLDQIDQALRAADLSAGAGSPASRPAALRPS